MSGARVGRRKDFYFRCQRSGNCCRVGAGRVWLQDGELERLAEAAGATVDAFVAQHVVRVGERLSLRERADGRCVLLEGTCTCTVYAARPQQCRDFPDWPGVREDPAALERAAAYCPGIQRLPGDAARNQGLAALRRIVTDGDADTRAPSAVCLTATGAMPVSSLEADAFLAAFPATSADREAPCPALDGARCTAGAARPLACRALPADKRAEAERSIQAAAANSGYPWSKADWPLIRADRAAAWRAAGRSPVSPLDV